MKKSGLLKIGLLLLGFTFFVARFYVAPQFPYTHDGENHLARFANYKIAVRELQIPPRIAPVLHNHFGYPVFNYNYPLANILSLPFSFAKVSYETTFSILVLSGLFGGSIGVFSWSGFFTSKREIRVFTALVWLTTPYVVSLLAYRGNIGEILAYALLPWMFTLIHWLNLKKSGRQLVLMGAAVAAFLLSHNITVVFAVPFLFVYAAIVFRKQLASWKRAALVGSIALGATLWFWLPALTEMNATVIGQTDNQREYTQHFVTLKELFSAPQQFGYSLIGTIDSLGFKIGFTSMVLPMLTLILSLVLSIKNSKTKEAKKWLLSLFVSFSALLALFMQLDSSQAIWRTLPFMRFMQFPWRWALFFFTFSVPLAATLLGRISKKIFIVLSVVWLFSIVPLVKLAPADTFTKKNVDYENFTLTTSTQNENMAKDFTYSAIGSWAPSAITLTKNTDTTLLTQLWTGREHVYTVATTEDITIVEPVMYFPGWETRVNGTLVEYTNSDEIKGRVAFTLAPGEYAIATEFTQRTWPRLIGNAAFFITLFVVFYLGLGYKKKV
ncbi:MAG: hypothetical protein GW762_05180 [Candidatus Pacebacteria bacterium]|nr:hypothetical protein [Candidatus Paceibacterota bacterium]PIR63861.1 MAG: hypothetical protein COU64_02725 [Candidatus Pacebacteria bacterium CG10_big_fil_rev_8_21_14_0_10_40_26]PIZ78363.1 MAG: hypothetical protein COY01_06305 [Candidatus Pacebacteria bacterium CG_4_10_14_0_2_um_filter_40_20]PJA68593.1 MAG: hypothetical protein CO156_03740 [Candidatus Pacebacteria bacterium CG_4_9_14_3_um_filter_40_12]PJC41533.1 MAG: hypothetical protein CO041_02330 [Candidatus Pacebacteria bacterium CG_4_9_